MNCSFLVFVAVLVSGSQVGFALAERMMGGHGGDLVPFFPVAAPFLRIAAGIAILAGLADAILAGPGLRAPGRADIFCALGGLFAVLLAFNFVPGVPSTDAEMIRNAACMATGVLVLMGLEVLSARWMDRMEHPCHDTAHDPRGETHE